MPLPLFALGAWGFVKNNWQLIAVSLAVAALMGYIGVLKYQVNNYKEKYEDAKATIAHMQRQTEDMQASFAGIERKYESALVETKARVEENAKLLEDLIQKDVELNTLRISYAAVGLFNQSKRDPAAPKAVKRDDGKTGTADPSGTANGLGKSVTLAQVFQIVATNDGNHWKCVKQVEAWQGWYLDVESAIDLAGKVQ
jgi:uncharacterized protein YukE